MDLDSYCLTYHLEYDFLLLRRYRNVPQLRLVVDSLLPQSLNLVTLPLTGACTPLGYSISPRLILIALKDSRVTLVTLDHFHEDFLGDVYAAFAELESLFLTFLLLFTQLHFACNISTIEVPCHIFLERREGT